MKTLELKKLKLLYLNLIAIVFLLPSLGGAGGGLFAQDPDLFEHTWYLEKLVENNVSYYNSNYTYYTGTITFYQNTSEVDVFLCEFDNFQADINFPASASFEIFNVLEHPFFGDHCSTQDNNYVMFYNLYFNFFIENFNNPLNPFTYTIIPINDYLQLTIENAEGDWAVYNSVLLSTASFSQNSFTLYPNPVMETLKISNGSNQNVSAFVYDINGKKIQKHSFETNTSTIDVEALNPGLYFVVFENEAGERVSKKFVKQ